MGRLQRRQRGTEPETDRGGGGGVTARCSLSLEDTRVVISVHVTNAESSRMRVDKPRCLSECVRLQRMHECLLESACARRGGPFAVRANAEISFLFFAPRVTGPGVATCSACVQRVALAMAPWAGSNKAESDGATNPSVSRRPLSHMCDDGCLGCDIVH